MKRAKYERCCWTRSLLLFFVVFVNDLPDVVLPGNTIALFADDCKTSMINFVFNGTWIIFIIGVFATPWLLMSKSAKL